MKIQVVCLLGMIGMVVCTQPALAQILVEQGKISETVAPGGTHAGVIAVHNTADQPIRVKAYLEDFQYQPPFDGKKLFSPAGAAPRSIAKWFRFLPTEFDLPPYGKKEIHFTAKLPPDAKGGYYGVLFFEKTEQNLKDVTGVNIITRVGTLLFFESQDKKKKSHVGNLTAKGNAVAGIFKNGGDIIMIPQGTYFVLDGEGVPVDRGEISKFYLPPLESAAFSIPLAKELTQGQYSLVITFDLGEGDSVVKELDVRKNSDDSMTILQERD